MRITKSQLRKLIKEELDATLKEGWWPFGKKGDGDAETEKPSASGAAPQEQKKGKYFKWKDDSISDHTIDGSRVGQIFRSKKITPSRGTGATTHMGKNWPDGFKLAIRQDDSRPNDWYVSVRPRHPSIYFAGDEILHGPAGGQDWGPTDRDLGSFESAERYLHYLLNNESYGEFEKYARHYGPRTTDENKDWLKLHGDIPPDIKKTMF